MSQWHFTEHALRRAAEMDVTLNDLIDVREKGTPTESVKRGYPYLNFRLGDITLGCLDKPDEDKVLVLTVLWSSGSKWREHLDKTGPQEGRPLGRVFGQ